MTEEQKRAFIDLYEKSREQKTIKYNKWFKSKRKPTRRVKTIKRELCIPKYATKGNYIEIESKEQIKKRLGGKSPNIFDAVMYWNWVRKGYRMDKGFFLPIG